MRARQLRNCPIGIAWVICVSKTKPPVGKGDLNGLIRRNQLIFQWRTSEKLSSLSSHTYN